MSEEGTPQRASEWLLAMSESPNDNSLQLAFQDWLNASPDNAQDWHEISRAYELLGKTQPQHIAHWNDFSDRKIEPAAEVIDFADAKEVMGQKQKPKRRVALAAVYIGMAASALLFALPSIFDRIDADFTTGTGELRQVELIDGSIVDLAPDSLLKVAFIDDARRVSLLQGTAYFKVVPDAKHPFSVQANGVETTVLGTAFEVRNLGDDVSVSVAEGTVLVGSAQNKRDGTTLSVGQRIRMNNEAVISSGTVSPGMIATWRYGEFIANDTSVAEFVDEIRHYYGGAIYLQGERLAQQPLTGVYDLGDPLRALEAMAKAQGAEFYMLTPWIAIVTEG